ncbi:MAG: hypothetical protein H3C58_00805 [Fimbriimonadaceae bacterium]|nr:hypothetical protein [Fimbriimonadaceae bacterium]
MANVITPPPAPKDWIKALPFNPLTKALHVPTEKHLEEFFGEGPWRDIITEVYRGRAAVEDAKFAIENWDAEVYPGTSINDWLKGLADELSSSGTALDAYVKEKYGQAVLDVFTSNKIILTVNQLHHVGKFLLEARLEFDAGLKAFRVYDGKRGVWKMISNEEVIRRLMEFTVPSILHSPLLFKSNHSFFKSLFENAKSLAMMNAVSRPYTIIGASNTVIVIEDTRIAVTGFSPVYKLTHSVPTEYDPKKNHPTKFVGFLKSILEEQEDVDAFQLWCGMALLGKNPFHKILILSGKAGAGKSTLISLVEKMVGIDNCATLMTNRLEERFELSEFLGKTLLTSKDAGADFLSGDSAHMLKTLSGDSGIRAEVKFAQQRVTLEGPFNIIIGCNSELPVALREDVDAWKRRLILLQIRDRQSASAKKTTSQETAEEDPASTPSKPKNVERFDEYLIRKEGPAILNWMLRGVTNLRSLQKAKKPFPLTQRQEDIRDLVLFRSDSIPAFINTQLLKGTPSDEIATADLHERYLGFCEQKGLQAHDWNAFIKKIGNPLFKKFQATRDNTRTKPPQKGYRGVKFAADGKDLP